MVHDCINNRSTYIDNNGVWFMTASTIDHHTYHWGVVCDYINNRSPYIPLGVVYYCINNRSSCIPLGSGLLLHQQYIIMHTIGEWSITASTIDHHAYYWGVVYDCINNRSTYIDNNGAWFMTASTIDDHTYHWGGGGSLRMHQQTKDE